MKVNSLAEEILLLNEIQIVDKEIYLIQELLKLYNNTMNISPNSKNLFKYLSLGFYILGVKKAYFDSSLQKQDVEKLQGAFEMLESTIFFRENLVKEWLIWSQFYGKILVFTGPQSSGKTTLMNALLDCKLFNFVTITRKKIISESKKYFEQKYFKEAFEKAEMITKKKIEISDQLDEINSNLSYNEQQTLELIKKDINTKVRENFSLFLAINFDNYYIEIKKYIYSGYNVIIDETMSDPAIYHIFRYCCGEYSGIKRILLYDSLEGILNKCIVRNEKFVNLLSSVENVSHFKEQIKEKVISSNDSGIDLRNPAYIIEVYNSFYDFVEVVKSYPKFKLDNIKRNNLLEILNRMAEEQISLDENLKNKAYKNTEIKKIDIETEATKILKNYEEVAVVPKFWIDFVIQMSKVTHLNLLKDSNFLLDLLGDIKVWIQNELPLKNFDEEEIALAGENTDK